VKAAFVLLSAVIALSVLIARGEDVAAHYVLRGVTEVGSELLLKSDGTFEYILAYGAADYWAKGTWRQENNRVFLNSAGRKEAPFRLLRSEAGEPGKIRVWVIGKNGHAVENVEVALQAAGQQFDARTTSDGVAVFPYVAKARAVTFEVPVYSTKAGPFEIDAPNNDFYFEINGDAITQVFFKDEPLLIDGNDLVMKYWNEEQPIRYEKQ
jgi:hypothetical protein